MLQSNGYDRNEITGYSTTSATTLDNVDNTIAGAGTIGHGGVYNDPNLLLAFTNETSGTVDADSVGHTLSISTGANVTNNGTLEAHSQRIAADAVDHRQQYQQHAYQPERCGTVSGHQFRAIAGQRHRDKADLRAGYDATGRHRGAGFRYRQLVERQYHLKPGS